MEQRIQDLRDAFRALARAPGFSTVVVLTLALGIGASVTVFSVIEAVIWMPLPYPHAGRLVLLDADVNRRKNAGVAPLEASEIGRHSRTIEMVAAVSGVSANLTVNGELERVFAASANDQALVMLGAEPPALGRLTRDREDIGPDGFVRAVVISDRLWRRYLGADASAIGRHIQVNNIDVEVVGVLAPGLRVFLPAASNADEDIDVWFPRGTSDRLDTRDPATIARLLPGVSIAQAQAELDATAAGLVAEHPSAYANGLRLIVSPLQDLLTARVRPALLSLGVAVGFVLLISCVNVTNLLLARAKSREREIAVRVALGAGRKRVVAQLMAESVILAAAGGAAGLLLARFGVEWLDWLRPTHLPRQSQVAIDGIVTLFAVGVSAAVCVVCGLVPALRVSRQEDMNPLRAGRGASAPGIRRLQRGLVIAEVALSIVPLVGGGLMLRSFMNLTNAPIGFDPNGLLTARVQMSFRTFPDLEQRWTLIRNAIDRVKQLPGVEEVSAAGTLPFSQLNTRRIAREGDPSSEIVASQQSILPGYLSLTRTPIRQGRDVSEDDIRQGRMTAIVDERIASRFWPEGAVGRRLAVQIGGKPVTIEVVGVTPPVRAVRVSEVDIPHVFFSYNVSQVEPTLVIRTTKTAAVLGPEIRRVVEALGTGRPVVDIRPMREYLDRSIGETRFTMLMLTAFAAASLLLAGIGMYGTLAYLISLRFREFGLRMALGATAGSVMGLVVRESALLTGIGATAGMGMALAATSGLRALLYGVAPLDATTVVTVAALVAVVSFVAASVPAWRAARVDPSTALRSE